MNQPRWHSLVEAWSSTFIGFVISWATTILVMPLFGMPNVTASKSFAITSIFTVASVVRGYFVRRWFNSMLHKHLNRGVDNAQEKSSTGP